MINLRLLAIAASVLAIAGCKTTGGGFIDSALWNTDPEELNVQSPKAQFGFVADCTNVGEPGETTELDEASGQVQFSDNGSVNGNGDVVRFHGRVDGTTDLNFLIEEICQQPNDGSLDLFGRTYSGTYDAQPKKLGSGDFDFILFDEGEPGASSGDAFVINVTTGPFAGYSNFGFIAGGNIQFHP